MKMSKKMNTVALIGMLALWSGCVLEPEEEVHPGQSIQITVGSVDSVQSQLMVMPRGDDAEAVRRDQNEALEACGYSVWEWFQVAEPDPVPWVPEGDDGASEFE